MSKKESLPKIYLPLIYTTMWLDVFRIIVRNLSENPDLCYHAVVFFYKSLIPTIRKKVDEVLAEMSKETGMNLMKEIELINNFETMFVSDKQTVNIRSLPNEMLKVLKKYGVFYNAMGKVRYRPTKLNILKRNITMTLYNAITEGFYRAGVLTHRTETVSAG